MQLERMVSLFSRNKVPVRRLSFSCHYSRCPKYKYMEDSDKASMKLSPIVHVFIKGPVPWYPRMPVLFIVDKVFCLRFPWATKLLVVYYFKLATMIFKHPSNSSSYQASNNVPFYSKPGPHCSSIQRLLRTLKLEFTVIFHFPWMYSAGGYFYLGS